MYDLMAWVWIFLIAIICILTGYFGLPSFLLHIENWDKKGIVKSAIFIIIGMGIAAFMLHCFIPGYFF